MTPTEKAKELVDKFRNEFKWVENDYPIDLYRDTKQCALIAVQEAILYHPFPNEPDQRDIEFHKFWEEVKEEIKKL